LEVIGKIMAQSLMILRSTALGPVLAFTGVNPLCAWYFPDNYWGKEGKDGTHLINTL
jgi:hypothetical protein